VYPSLSKALSVALIAGLVMLGLPHSALAAVSASRSGTQSASAPSGAAKSRAHPRENHRGVAATPPRQAAKAQAPARGFSEEQRQRYAEQDKKDKKNENYKGGVTLIIGGGVLVVALLIVLIIVIVD
jgi:cobalamin biosynthesis Mg chelatase CobN